MTNPSFSGESLGSLPKPNIHTPDEALSADSSQLLDLVSQQANLHQLRTGIDYYDHRLWYGLKVGEEPYFLASGAQAIRLENLPNGVSAIPESFSGPPISDDGIKRYLSGAQVDGGELIRELEQLFARHAKFQHNTTPTLLAHWALGSYLYMAFPTYPYLWITSAQKGSGKTTVEELLAAVAFRSTGIMVDPTPAVLYRLLDQLGSVLLVDEFEKASDDTQRTLVSILNAGFRRGTRVPRCASDDFHIEWFNAYSPKVFAGLNRLPDTLESRTIPIQMFPKTKKDGILSFSVIHQESTLRRLRDDMGIWALCNAKQCAELVVQPVGLGLPACLDDRAADYMAPLFAVSRVAGSDTDCLRAFCETLAEFRQTESRDTMTAQVIAALKACFPAGETNAKIHLSDVAKRLVDTGVSCDEKRVGLYLRKLGIVPKQVRTDTANRKGIEITREQLDDSAERFPAMAESEGTTGTPAPSHRFRPA